MVEKTKLILIIIGITVVGLLFWGAYYISPQDVLMRSDAIVVLSGGDTSARTLEAVQLYQERWARQLVFSGAAKDPESRSNARAMREIAVSQGVPPDIITVEEDANTTKQNAAEVAAIIEALKYKKVILVTSPYHQRRAFVEFRSRFPDDVQIINHSASKDSWNPETWWQSPRGWYLTATELPKAIFATIIQ